MDIINFLMMSNVQIYSSNRRSHEKKSRVTDDPARFHQQNGAPLSPLWLKTIGKRHHEGNDSILLLRRQPQISQLVHVDVFRHFRHRPTALG